MKTRFVEQVRRRVEGWRAAEARERVLRRQQIVDAGVALDAALELCELDPSAGQEPDRVRREEVGRARSAWAKLRRRLAWQGAKKPHG